MYLLLVSPYQNLHRGRHSVIPCESGMWIKVSFIYLIFKIMCLSVFLIKIHQGHLGAWSPSAWSGGPLTTHICVSVLPAGRRSGSPMHRQHSQGAEEVLPGSRGPWQSPMLLGTHFRSQGESNYLPSTFPLGLPSSHLGNEAAGRWWWGWWRNLKGHIYLFLLFKVSSV